MGGIADVIVTLFRVVVTVVVLALVIGVSIYAVRFFAGREGRRQNRHKVRTALINVLAVGLLLVIRPAVEPALSQIGAALTPLLRIPDQSYVAAALIGLYYTVTTVLLLTLYIQGLGALFWWFEARLIRWRRSHPKRARKKKTDLTPHIFRGLRGLNRAFRVVGLSVAFLVLLPTLLNFFPRTAIVVSAMLEYWGAPLREIADQIIDYLPNLGYITVILALGWGFLKLTRYAFVSIDNGTLVIPEFDRDWSMPTYKLVRTLWLLFLLMAIYPYLPGSDSKFFQGFSLFAGALVTFGSAGAIGNIVAGIVLTYTSAFRLGDVVRIGDSTGRVIGKTLLVTRLRTPRNEDITVPNGTVLANTVTNFTSNARKTGVGLPVAAGIGYDVDRRQVAELLTEAARKTKYIVKYPSPLVLQTGLGDYAVNYELWAFTNRPDRLFLTHSELRGNVIDCFNAAGVEIMTPSVLAHRDASGPAIPAHLYPGEPQIHGIAIDVRDPASRGKQSGNGVAATST